MAGPTSEEQYLLELINDTRLDPLGNAARYLLAYEPLTSLDPDIRTALNYFGVDGSALLSAYRSLSPVAPLAWNDDLADAAERHSARLIEFDVQSHQVNAHLGSGHPDYEKPLGARVLDEGYIYRRLGENVYSYSESLTYGHAGFMVDWGFDAVDDPNGDFAATGDGMQDNLGHRRNIMDSRFSEVGIDVSHETDPATRVGPLVITQDFGDRGELFLLGVAYRDLDGDGFYSIGEGLGGLIVQSGSEAEVSGPSGGYALAVESGPLLLSISGGGLPGTLTVMIAGVTGNVKLDIVDGVSLLTSGSIVVEGPVAELRGLGTTGLDLAAGPGDQRLAGTPGNDTLAGGPGSDTLWGGRGEDVAVFGGYRLEYAIAARPDGRIIVGHSMEGHDTLSSIEILRFADGDFTWDPTSETVNQPPATAPAQSVSTKQDYAVPIHVSATDGDGDPLTYVAEGASHGMVTGGSGGIFTYVPQLGFSGNDAFVVTVADGRGGIVHQQIGVLVAEGAKATAPYRLVAGDGFAGTIGGVGSVAGTNGLQDLTLSGRNDSLDFDDSFAQGGDIIRFPGLAVEYAISLSGTAALLSDGASLYRMPLGVEGVFLDFADGPRVLRFDEAREQPVIGNQVIGSTPAAILGPDDGSLLSGADRTDAAGRLALREGSRAEVGGSVEVFGTNGPEDITYLSGNIRLDGSFARGGDVLHLREEAPVYSAHLSGTSFVLSSPLGSLSIPIGTAGAILDFAGDRRVLHFDPQSGEVRLDKEAISASSLGEAEPLGERQTITMLAQDAPPPLDLPAMDFA